jgi:V/A-type H+-transporting ATPase subunit D
VRAPGRVPPGRAGRLWLARRLDTAERGRDQLDRKLRILVQDQQRMRILAERARAEWRTAYREADTWLLRAAVLGGQDAVRGAAASSLVQVDVTWASEMGLSYPATVELVPTSGTVDRIDGNAALAPAAAAFRVALLAAARSGAAEEAVRLLELEVALTKRRLRALEKRWVPWLQESLGARELALEQSEQEDGIRTRRALAGAQKGGAVP